MIHNCGCVRADKIKKKEKKKSTRHASLFSQRITSCLAEILKREESLPVRADEGVLVTRRSGGKTGKIHNSSNRIVHKCPRKRRERAPNKDKCGGGIGEER